MSDMMEEKDKVLSFTMIKIEKGREKVCRCTPDSLRIHGEVRRISKRSHKKGGNLQGMGRERMEAEDEEQSIQGNGQLLS